MLKDMKGNITRDHNIPFLSDIITRSMLKVMKDNIRILSTLTRENLLLFFSLPSFREEAEERKNLL